MTAFSVTGLDPSLLDKSKYAIIYQTGSNGGTVPSPLRDIAGTPLFAPAMQGKIADPLAQKAFDVLARCKLDRQLGGVAARYAHGHRRHLPCGL